MPRSLHLYKKSPLHTIQENNFLLLLLLLVMLYNLLTSWKMEFNLFEGGLHKLETPANPQ